MRLYLTDHEHQQRLNGAIKRIIAAAFSILTVFCCPAVSKSPQEMTVPSEIVGRYAHHPTLVGPHCPKVAMHVTSDGFVFVSEERVDENDPVCPLTVTENQDGWISGKFNCPAQWESGNDWSVGPDGYMFVERGPHYNEEHDTQHEFVDIYVKCSD